MNRLCWLFVKSFPAPPFSNQAWQKTSVPLRFVRSMVREVTIVSARYCMIRRPILPWQCGPRRGSLSHCR